MDEDDWDEASEWDDLPEWGRNRDDAGEDCAAVAAGEALTSGERLLYALGQLYLLWHRGELPVAPRDFDIEDLARIIGVARDIEFTSEGPLGRSVHFPSEVLLIDGRQRFPWRLFDLDGWARVTDGFDGS